MNILDALYLTPPVVTSKPHFQNTFSAIATLFPICYLSLLKDLDMNAIVSRKAREAHLIHKAKTIEPLGMSTKDVPVKHIDACAYKMPSCCSVEAIKNTKLCKLYEGTKGFTNADPAWAPPHVAQ